MSNACIEKSNKWFDVCKDISSEVKSLAGGCNNYYRVLFSQEIESFSSNLKENEKQSFLDCSKAFLKS